MLTDTLLFSNELETMCLSKILSDDRHNMCVSFA